MILVFRALSAVFPVLVTLIVSARFDAQSAGAFFTAFSLVTFLSTILRLGVDDRILNICAAASELCEVMRPVVKTIWPILVGILLLVAFLYYYLPGNGNAVTVSFRALLPILFRHPP